MDKTWLKAKLPRASDRYKKGVDAFLDFAFLRSIGGKIPCPCKRCLNCRLKNRYEVRTDLICNGFDENYDQWDAHGEVYRPKFVDVPIMEVIDDSDGEGDESDAEGSTQSTAASPSTLTESPTPISKDLSTCLPRESDDTKELYFRWISDRYNKDRRHDLYTKYYQKYDNDEDRLKNCPKDITADDWKYLVHYFGTPKFKAMSKRNKRNRAKLGATNTTGSCSLRKRRMMKEETRVAPDVTFFEATHIKKDGTAVNKKSGELIGSNIHMPTLIFPTTMKPPQEGRCLGYDKNYTELYGRQGSEEEQLWKETVDKRMLQEEENKRFADQISMMNEHISEMVEAKVAAMESQIYSLIESRMAVLMPKVLQQLGIHTPHQFPNDNQLDNMANENDDSRAQGRRVAGRRKAILLPKRLSFYPKSRKIDPLTTIVKETATCCQESRKPSMQYSRRETFAKPYTTTSTATAKTFTDGERPLTT